MIRSENIRLLLAGIGMVIIQVILLRHLKIFGAESDLVLLYILWYATKKSKTEVLIMAALLGFLQDSMTDMWGVHMFSKTLMSFILYGFLNRISENRFITWQIFFIIIGAAFLHNSIFFMVTLFSELYATAYFGWKFLIVSTLFTAVVGSFLHLVRVDQ